MRLLNLAAIAFASAVSLPAVTQDAPGRVGRLAYTEGPVSVYQDPELGWEKAYVNSPVTSENSVWTDRAARAEVRVGGIAIRMDATTQLDVAHLDDDGIDALVASGSVAIRVRHKQADERMAFSTPNARFVLDADGSYRVDVDAERDESRLTVFKGGAHMESQRGSVRVDAGRSVVVWGQPSPSYALEKANTDAFDRWALTRDEQWSERSSVRYVSTSMTGYEDLDRYGEWRDDADYGSLWFPTRVSSSWAPYREGHWGYVRPWGWTWIDDAPWGYAPFHYGRWVQVRDRWAWDPGRRTDRPAWAPALVAWVGGSNWSVGIGSGAAGAVGWYPLAPWDRYEPWYRTNRNYLDRVNVVVRDPPARYQDSRPDWRTWNRDRGATVVQRETLIAQRPVASAMVSVTREQIRSQPVATPTQVLPQRNELVRRRTQTDQAAAPVPAPRVSVAPAAAGAPASRAPAGAPPANTIARPDFTRRAAPSPAPAPANQAPPSAAARGQPAAPAQTPAARAQQQQQERAAKDAQQQQQFQQRARETQQQQQQQERAAKDAQQQQQQQQQQRARETQQQQERAAKDAQQQQQQFQQRARETQQQQQQQERAAKDAQQQQQQFQQRARETQQQQQQQERAAKDAQQQQQQQQFQQRARETQQQQERAAKDAQQQQQQQLQQRAREAQQQQQERAAKEAQKQQQQQQQLQQRAREAPPAKPPQQAQPPQAQPQPPAFRPPRAPEGDKDKGKDKDKKDKDKDDKQK